MKALTTGPSMYPGTTFRSTFLLCSVLLSLYSTVHGNNYQQDGQKTWKNLSKVLLYDEDQTPSSSSQNVSSKLPKMLDENNIMHTKHLLNDDDTEYATYSEEYEQDPEAHRPAELKTSLSNLTVSSATVETPAVKSPNDTSRELESSEIPSDLYDSYYYYYDYDNDTRNDSALSEDSRTNLSSTEEPTYIENPANHSTLYDNFSDSELYDSDEATSMEGSNKHFVVSSNLSKKLPDKSILIGEAVVSVVTTKSVVNGTISVPVTPLPQTTEQISSPLASSEPMEGKQMERHQTTENSIVLASVQTSRSISGARFLPFPVVEQVVQVAPNVNKEGGSKSQSGTLESTESIIDKLDRVQSELSSGFLSGGFRNSGNTLQLDVMPETETTTKKRITTMRSPVITKFVPHRPNTNRKPFGTLKPLVPNISKFNRNETRPYTTAKSVTNRPPPQLRPTVTKPSGNENKETIVKPKIVVQDVSAFLPPGFNLDKVKSEPTERSIIDDIVAKAKVDISAFLPPGFKEPKQNATSDQKKIEKIPVAVEKPSVDLSSLLPPGYKPKAPGDAIEQPRIDDLFKATKVDIASLLPPGFNLKTVNESSSKNDTEMKEVTSTSEAPVSTTKAAGFKLVFPSRPGGRKPITRITTPSSLHGGAPGGFKPAIHKGWPTRATTEFTGWPTSSTTPISIEKLLEAARTATNEFSNMSSTTSVSMTSTTTTTTTTTTTPRPTTPGVCQEDCELAGTIRLVGKRPWVPELLDSNTVEWKELASDVEAEIELAFSKSPALRKWYKKIKIDSFSQGSILVDYFVELNDIGTKINTQELKSIFHETLNSYVSNNNENSTKSKNLLVLGKFTIDPASTDFVVVPKSAIPQQMDDGDAIIPQWAIAVIVIGVGGLLFIIVFGVSVLMNRHNVSKIKPKMPTIFDEERENNMIHKSQLSPGRRSLDYPKEDLYNIDADWNDKSFDSTSNKMMVDGPYQDSRYNLHDSWKSEWNGYYYNASHSSNRTPGYGSTTAGSRHHPDYDTNF